MSRQTSARTCGAIPLSLSAAIAAILAGAPAWSQTAPGNAVELEEVVVTGTLLRGSTPTGTNVVTVTSDDIAATGKTNAIDLLTTIPQLGQFNSIPAGGTGQGQPTVRPALRNLTSSGNNPTLILLNGNRMIGAGILQTSPDPSVIPPGVIERLDVVPDGGSATYGSDAVGGVINFITKRRFDGIELSGQYGGVSGYHSSDLGIIVGKDWGSGSAYLAFANNQHNAIFGRDRDFVTANNTPRGGTDFRSTNCVPGTVAVAGVNYPLPGQVPGARNLCDPTDSASYYPREFRNSFYGHVFQELTDSLTLEAEAYRSERTATTWGADTTRVANGTITPANPYYQQIPGTAAGASQSVTTALGTPAPSFGLFRAQGITSSLTWDLASSWQVRGTLNFGRSYNETNDYTGGVNSAALAAAYAGTTLATAFNPYNPGASNPAVIQNIGNWAQYANSHQEFSDLQVVADGDVFELPGGAVRLALGAALHRDTYEPVSSNVGPDGAQTRFTSDGSRTVRSAFGEVLVPLVGDGNSLPGLRALELSASVRHDSFSRKSIGSTTNPKFGLNYRPVDEVTFRANYGKSFNAPSLADTNSVDYRAQSLPFVLAYQPGANPVNSPGGTVLFAGGNPDLRPETATTQSFGADWQVSFVPGLTLSATWWDIDYKNRIGLAPFFNAASLFGNNGAFAGYYLIRPTQAQLESIFQGVRLDGFGSIAQLYAGGNSPYIYTDARRNNLAQVLLNGVDFNVMYNVPTSFGSINASVGGTRTLKNETTASPGAPSVDTLTNGTRKLAYVASLGARVGALSGRLTYNYSGGYPITQANNSRIDSFKTVGLFAAYDFGTEGWLAQTVVTLNVDNLTDEEPPYSNVSGGTANGSTAGRLVSFGVTKRFDF